jgi:outer membrane receptor protein involved in Fe transport
MLFFRLKDAAFCLCILAVAGFVANNTAPVSQAQTITTGALSGIVADATGAVIPGATVVVIDAATDARQTVTTNTAGRYTIGLLKPGAYKVVASASGMKSDTHEISVILGVTVSGDITVTPQGDNTVIEVSASVLPLVDTQNIALATTFNEQQIQELPMPGGDVTTVAFTLPGVVVNAGGEFGNFSSDGLPGISNLFVLNGFDNQDPFLNLNNSGSSNLTLGQGELADATVIQNAYNSQYGRAAGAIVSYTTKSGGNKYHGEASYNYNGTVLNANGWFNNLTGTPRPHAVSNEWALNGGGPIIKDKLFFFADYEGLHYVLPASGFVSLPTQEYENYTLNNIPAASQATYNQMFGLYNNSPVHSTATPYTASSGGCGSLAGVVTPDGTTLGSASPCVLSGFAQANNINQEFLFTGRGDWVINDKHKIYGRFKLDHGTQPTATSFINPAFNVISTQPEYEGQFNDSYAISPNLINTVVLAANWYTAFFGPQSVAASQAVLPFFGDLDIGADGSGTAQIPGLSNIGISDGDPQGRNVTQYQIEEDLSWTRGKHSLKFGANFRRDDVEDFDGQEEQFFPLLAVFSLNDIAQGGLNTPNSQYGGANEFQQAFPNADTAHLALYNLGVYAQDEWQILPKLKLTVGARVDRTGSPLCRGNCFSQYNGNFPNAAASLTNLYSSEITPANAHPFSVEPIEFQPRFGINYQLDDKTVIRTGMGFFADLYPNVFLDSAFENFPNDNTETILAGNIAGAGAGSIYANAAGGNTVVQNGFATGSVTTLNNALTAQGIPFNPPTLGAFFPGTFHEPGYVEWSLQIQRQLSKSDGISLTYAGNHGYNEIIQNPYVNAASGEFNNATGTWQPTSAGAFAGLPVAPPDPALSTVNSFTNNARSNYNGVSVSYTHQGHGVNGHLSYTYSHDLDDTSNGGVGDNEPFNPGSLGKQLTPSLIGAANLNYSNADYDIRNDLVGDLVYEEPFKVHNAFVNPLVSGWVLAGKEYYRSGEPFSVLNSNVIAGFPVLAGLGSTLLAQSATSGPLTNTCGSNPHAAVNTSCLDATQYVGATQNTFGNVRRNAFYGPHYADTDATLTKQIVKKEGINFVVGTQIYNLFNHPNFGNPGGTNGDGNFGLISNTQAPPTSPYGSFQSAAVTQRVLVVTGKITF